MRAWSPNAKLTYGRPAAERLPGNAHTSQEAGQGWQDSNPRPPTLEAGALPAELHPFELLGKVTATGLLLLSMQGVLPAWGAVLPQLHASLLSLTMLGRGVVPRPAVRTCHRDYNARLFRCHGSLRLPSAASGLEAACRQPGPFYSITFETTPAPTVWPPSRTANRRPSSIAIGCRSSAVMVMLSPGITISTPSGRYIVPVTSVVRK